MPEPTRPRTPTPSPPIENSYVVPGTLLAAGEYPGSRPSEPAAVRDARLARFLDAGIRSFVDLTSPDDRMSAYEPWLRALATPRGHDVRFHSLPIEDMGICDARQMRRILDAIDAELAAARPTYVHCWGGVGRTGTVIGCWLVRQGRTGEEALREVSRLFATMPREKVVKFPDGSPQTDGQRSMVLGWDEARQ